MLVKDLMTTAVTSVTPGSPAAAAVKIMRSEDVGIVPVCDIQGHLLGVITDRDIIMRIPDFGSFDVRTTTLARDIMTTDVSTVSSTAEIHDAAKIFANKKVHRLPVLENGKLAGMLSISDLAKKRVFLAEVGDIIGSIAE